MGLVLAMAAALWGMGVVMKAPIRVRAVMLGALWAAVVLVHLVLPEGHVLRLNTGGSVVPWLMLGGIAALVLAYRAGLRWLRARAVPVVEAAPQTFTETELNRYARHIVLREIGGKGQKRLKNARVLVIGAGGLGSPALLYLAAAGVGTIGVIDDDEVDNSNLQRQVIHSDAAIGMPKVFSAQKAMEAQNPFVTVRPYKRRLAAEDAEALFAEYDLVLDGTDNFTTRYLANAAAVKRGIPLISGALAQWEGQISVFDPAKGGPCYQCVFPQAPAAGLAPSCAEAGVIGPLPGVIGAMMAVEAVKLIAGAGAPLRGEMLIYDALWGETRKITLKKRADCPVCGGMH
ncbi:molybdopterin-synthase adenylyltransferase MoeB [Thalassobius vesicularis]|uniref:Molybdopterin-synthase adenylyltransferase n=1 Tax=Thalassobius vesicularis TaxID=1294297 RepID=A0A4S3MCG5_9RHOB|nr:molybdopterin-synthase adenylyltransferase MoeB [Thalassobius vesicularis]THD76360.1 molybdopterin-synthase adenylyltransferase MoeB [Thalassobius vesicularis]